VLQCVLQSVLQCVLQCVLLYRSAFERGAGYAAGVRQ